MDDTDLTNTIINPYYAITINPNLTGEHPSITTEDQWIEANLRLMEEIGTRQWLERLLIVLQGAGPRNLDEAVELYDEPEAS